MFWNQLLLNFFNQTAKFIKNTILFHQKQLLGRANAPICHPQICPLNQLLICVEVIERLY